MITLRTPDSHLAEGDFLSALHGNNSAKFARRFNARWFTLAGRPLPSQNTVLINGAGCFFLANNFAQKHTPRFPTPCVAVETPLFSLEMEAMTPAATRHEKGVERLLVRLINNYDLAYFARSLPTRSHLGVLVGRRR